MNEYETRLKYEELFRSKVAQFLTDHADRVEMLTAAFVAEVGNSEASKYVLVRERSPDGRVYRWWFEPKNED